jgi:ABC-2 type transport system ATP-binding protein
MRRSVLTASLALAVLICATITAVPAVGQSAVERGSITSFDGTPIVYNLFVPAGPGPFPAVLSGHGWSGRGQTQFAGFVKRLVDHGYVVLTWDARGFGASGGETHLNAPEYEARDVSALVDLLADRTEVVQDGPGDPRVGMNAGSYAGAIQLVSAAFDPRIDAIAPRNTWHDLRYSLYPNGVTKLVLGAGLTANGLRSSTLDGVDSNGEAGVQTGSYSTGLLRASLVPNALGTPDQETLDWLAERSLSGYGADAPVRVPTLLVQGLTDPLFRLNEALWSMEAIRPHAPTKLIAWCGGHAPCPYVRSGENHVNNRVLGWFERYLKDRDVDTGPAVEYLDNQGHWRSADRFEEIATDTLVSTGSARIVSSGAPTGTDPDNVEATRATTSREGDPGTMTIATPVRAGELLVGVPRARLRVSGTGPGAHLFVKIVDREANHVLGMQETPVRVGLLSAETQTIELELAALAYRVPAEHHVDVQISTSSLQFADHRGGAVVDIEAEVTLPILPAAAVPDPDVEPAPPPGPQPAPSASPEPSPDPNASPASPQLLPVPGVTAAGRVPQRSAPNTFVMFGVSATSDASGTTTGSFFIRDPIANGARINTVGRVDSLQIVGDTATVEGPCDVTGDPDARCTIVLRDLGAPGAGVDRVSFAAPGYSEGNTIEQGEVVVQRGG